VTRQYCGQLGKQDNCQVAVSLSLANHDASLPIAYRLYLPEDWAKDQARRDKAKVPETIAFQTKPEIALEQIKAARTAGLPQGVVLMDAGYGNDTGLRTDLRWRIERDYQELKQELGLGDYEGRGWRGFHHHATLCIAAYGFLIAERGALPPSEPRFSPHLGNIPDGYRPRGTANPTRTSHPQFDRDHSSTPHRRPRQELTEMPLLQRTDPKHNKNYRLLTQ
jgi:SRSO17 transposase